jgi:membrane associated rhomboid family serine protease
MRQRPFNSHRSTTVMLLIANVAAFILQTALYRFSDFQAKYLALSLEGLEHGRIWQLLTYQFMHVSVLHLLFNCWAVYVFGRDVERALGRKTFLTLYFSSGVVGGLAEALAGLTLGNAFAGSVVGASAAAFGLVAAFARLFPDRVLLLFFILPMRAKWLLALCGGLAILGVVSPPDGTAHAAHLGGMLTGILFIRYAIHWPLPKWWHWPRIARHPGQSPRRLVKARSLKPGLWTHNKEPLQEDLPPDEFVSKEVDPILDKISAHGIHSLTERERRVLETARAKMAKR